MASTISNARSKQRPVITTLLDLKNAIGEVHHNRISEILNYHHVPAHIQCLIRSLYTDFQTSIIIDSFRTHFITVGRSVLQGDCLSPLTFNMRFNNFIHYISDPKFQQFGFSLGSLLPIYNLPMMMQSSPVLRMKLGCCSTTFNDGDTGENLIICVDKCLTVVIKKASTSSMQYLPKLVLNHDLVPTVEIGKSFKYLGRHFNVAMDTYNHMSEVLDIFSGLMKNIDCIPCHPKYLLYHRLVLSKVSWHFTIANLSKT